MNKPEKDDPIALFQEWLEKAVSSEPINPNAMALATAMPDGAPSVRMVLLKDADPRGFVFYTNLGSQKAEELATNPACSLCFYWKSLGRQVRVEGLAQAVDAAEADAYFDTRPREARIGAWASKQSQPLTGPLELEKAVAKKALRFSVGKIPRPDFWSGFRVVPNRIEFWRERPFRLHERNIFTRDSGAWKSEGMYP
jgi:pyridoxamine 5'-phosphate oxidase